MTTDGGEELDDVLEIREDDGFDSSDGLETKEKLESSDELLVAISEEELDG